MRIRTIKPEWLEDERLSNASAEARVLSIALILLSDDFGRGRGATGFLGSRAFPNNPCLCAPALDELIEIGFVRIYVVRNQHYFSVVNWSKHQRVDKPGKSQIPPPQDEEGPPVADTDFTYFIVEEGKAVKIGRSWSPEGRLKRLQESTRRKLTLVGVIPGGWQEREMHRRFAEYQIGKREWFHLRGDLLDFLRDEFGFDTDVTPEDSRSIRERGATGTNAARSQVMTDQDLDPDPDPIPRPGPIPACAGKESLPDSFEDRRGYLLRAHRDRYEQATGNPVPSGKNTPQAVDRVVAWLAGYALRTGQSFPDAVEAVLGRWWADPYAQKRGWPLALLAKDVDQFADALPAKLAVIQGGMLRPGTHAEHAADAAAGGAPWDL